MSKKTKTDYSQSELDINKEFPGVLISSEAIQESLGAIIPTTLGLDIALSGGIPEGCIVNTAGMPKFGKTTLYLTILRNAQKMGKKTYYVDVESRLKPTLLNCIPGLLWHESQPNPDNLPLLKIITSSDDKILSCEDYMNIMATLFKSEKRCMIALDSIAAMTTAAVLGQKIGESKKMAGIPTLMYEFLRAINPVINVNKSNLLTITHLQANPTAYGGPTEVGGNAIQYFSSIRLKCLSSQETPKESSPKVGRDAIFKITASALGSPSGEAIVPIRYGRGVDEEEDLVNVAEEMGYVERTGAWYKIKGVDEKMQGRQSVIDYYKSNHEARDKIIKEIRESVFGQKA